MDFAFRLCQPAAEGPITAPTYLARQVQVLTKYVSQHDGAAAAGGGQKLGSLDGSGALGIIPQLVKTAATWKESQENKCTCSLQALLGALLLELARMEGDKAA